MIRVFCRIGKKSTVRRFSSLKAARNYVSKKDFIRGGGQKHFEGSLSIRNPEILISYVSARNSHDAAAIQIT